MPTVLTEELRCRTCDKARALIAQDQVAHRIGDVIGASDLHNQ